MSRLEVSPGPLLKSYSQSKSPKVLDFTVFAYFLIRSLIAITWSKPTASDVLTVNNWFCLLCQLAGGSLYEIRRTRIRQEFLFLKMENCQIGLLNRLRLFFYFFYHIRYREQGYNMNYLRFRVLIYWIPYLTCHSKDNKYNCYLCWYRYGNCPRDSPYQY